MGKYTPEKETGTKLKTLLCQVTRAQLDHNWHQANLTANATGIHDQTQSIPEITKKIAYPTLHENIF